MPSLVHRVRRIAVRDRRPALRKPCEQDRPAKPHGPGHQREPPRHARVKRNHHRDDERRSRQARGRDPSHGPLEIDHARVERAAFASQLGNRRGAHTGTWYDGFTAALASRPEREVDRAQQAQSRPEKVELHRLLHVEHRERHEHRERDHFLQHLQLREIQRRVADAVCRHLEQVLEERDAPAHEHRDDPRFGAEILEVGVPGERHEDVRADEQNGGRDDDAHGRKGYKKPVRRGTVRAAAREGLALQRSPVPPRVVVSVQRHLPARSSRGR